MSTTFLRILGLILLPTVVWGQSLNLSATSNTSGNDPSTFLLQEGKIAISTNEIEFLNSGVSVNNYEAFGISPDRSIISVLTRTTEGGQVTLFNSTGDSLHHYDTISLASNDPSLNVYPFNSGDIMVRNNITNFTFYDTFGEISSNMSSSSQSEEGEVISEVTMNDEGKTLIIYNPKIKRNGTLGSKAQVKLPEGQFENIFSSRDRFIKDVIISDDGGVVSIVTSGKSSTDQVLVMDKFGNELNRINTDEILQGVAFSNENEYITLYSQGRVMVYPTLGGDRIGSTSIRSNVFRANYFPKDDLILVLNGSYSEHTGILNNVEIRAIDLEQRQIASAAYGSAIGFNQTLKPRFVRTAPGSYEVKGASRELTISASF